MVNCYLFKFYFEFFYVLIPLSHMDLRHGLMNWIMSRKYRSLGFDETEYDRQNAQIKQLEEEVQLLTSSQNAIENKQVNNNKE